MWPQLHKVHNQNGMKASSEIYQNSYEVNEN